MVMEDMQFEETFESAIPGQSLAREDAELGSVPFETPADFPDPDEFYMYLYDKLLNDETNLMNIVKLLEMEITVDAIVEGLLMNSFMMGQISPDTGVILKEPVTDMVLLIAQEAEITPARRDDGADMQDQVRIEEVLSKLSADASGEEDMPMQMEEDDDMGEPSGMMAPPDGMDDMMAMDDMGEEMPEQEEEEDEQQQTALMMG
jgi:hypothetical protein